MQDCCIGFFENSKPSILVFRHDSEQFLVSKPEHDQGQLGPKDKLGEASLKPEGSTESGGKEALCSLSDSVLELRSLPSFLAFVIDSTGATLQPQDRRRPSGGGTGGTGCFRLEDSAQVAQRFYKTYHVIITTRSLQYDLGVGSIPASPNARNVPLLLCQA